MLTIAHFSDLHYSAKNLVEADRCFAAAVDDAIARRADVAVITGDSTDHALDLHSPAASALAGQIRRLADHCPVLMLQGTFSHEPPGTLAIFALLGGRHEVHIAERIEQVVLTNDGRWHRPGSWLADKLLDSDRALLTCVPTVNKASVAAAVGALSASSAVGEELATLLRGFAPINEQARRQGVATIGLSHGTVFGCLTEHGVPMAGFDHEFTTGSLFAAGAQAFMLGHIHRHQAWEQDGRWIAYPGSIGRFHYGEEGDKGYLLWEVGAATARCVFIPTPARRTVDLVFEGKPDMDAVRAAVSTGSVDGAFVRVRWTVAEEERGKVDREQLAAALAGAREVKLEGRIVPVVRTRAAGIARANTLAGKLAVWSTSVGTDAQPLIERLALLEQHTSDDIAQGLLARPTQHDGEEVSAPAEPERTKDGGHVSRDATTSAVIQRPTAALPEAATGPAQAADILSLF
jgi:exonuclease SbcD